jgi:hypothetical protein
LVVIKKLIRTAAELGMKNFKGPSFISFCSPVLTLLLSLSLPLPTPLCLSLSSCVSGFISASNILKALENSVSGKEELFSEEDLEGYNRMKVSPPPKLCEVGLV